jgi:hypothetical protein
MDMDLQKTLKMMKTAHEIDHLFLFSPVVLLHGEIFVLFSWVKKDTSRM